MSVKLKQVFSGKRLDEVHALYETAFPASEKKPFSMIVSGQGTGLVEILSLEENNRFLGLAIMAKAGDRVLLDYLPSRMKCGGMEPALRHFRRSVRDIKA